MSENHSRDAAARRTFLKQAAAASLAALAAGGGKNETAAAADDNQHKPPADLPHALNPTSGDLGSLYRDLDALAEQNHYAYSWLGDHFASFAEFQQAGRDKVFELLDYRPQAVAPRAEVVDRQDLGDYVREKVVFSTSPQFRVPAYVLIPKGLREPAPAVVDLHSHGGMFLFGKEKVVDLGANHPVMTRYHERNYESRPTSTELVRRGYVVITIDAFMFGERRLMMDADLKYGWDRSKYSEQDAAHLNGRCRAKESTLAKSMVFAGGTWPGVVFRDDLRTVDYLVTREEVDAERIGCCGVSMGGYRTLYLAALDPRIKAACVVGFMSTVRPMLQAHIDTHSWVHFLPGLHRWLDLPDVAALHAPQPLMVQQCRQDGLFTLEGMRQSLEQIAASYKKAGAADRFVGRMVDVPHTFNRAMQDDCFAFFDRWLGK
ncbi:MAG: alpha/beta hydrolase family protein [Pirellulaceae bacterium]